MEPIDLVIPMVFPQDPLWLEAYNKKFDIDATTNVRYRSWDTEELLIQCCLKYMPWVHTIFILLASESLVLDWILKYDKVKVVFHREFIPEHLLPTFNVNTIEMFLHKIPNLSELFIYSNDDFFPLCYLDAQDFFYNGLPCLHMTEQPYPKLPNIFHRFVMGGLNMVAADFGKHFTDTWLRTGHSMLPMLKSTVEEVYTKHEDQINQSFTDKRTVLNFNQYIFPFYQHFTGKYIDFAPKRLYVGLNTQTEQIPEILRDIDAGVVCLNDNENISDWKKRAEIVKTEITRRVLRPLVTITITSSLKNISFIPKTLNEVYNLMILPDVVILHLPAKEFPNKTKDLPEEIRSFVLNYGLLIKWDDSE